MKNSINTSSNRFQTLAVVLPLVLSFAVIKTALHPKPQLNVVLDLTAQKQFCELHGVALETDFVPADCVEEYAAFPTTTYPNAWRCTPGCVPYKETWAKVGYCDKCRGELRWQQFKWNTKTTFVNLQKIFFR